MLKGKVGIQYHMTEEHTFTSHPDLCFLQRDQSSHLPPSKKAFISSQSPLREPWFRGTWSYTGAPEHWPGETLLV